MILIACPACARQYDVTHVVPGSTVRCACDRTFEVAWRSPVSIPHAKCGNCGGAVRARPAGTGEAQRCEYCGATLAAGGGMLCPGCFARIAEDSRHCRACGIEIRPQALPPIPGGRRCPRCSGELRIRVLEQDELIECAACTGVWVPEATFARLESDARKRATSGELGQGEKPRAREEKVRYIPCLACGELMLRKQFVRSGRASGVIVDQCKDHGLWLDPSELERVLAFVRQEARRAGAALTLPEPPPEARDVATRAPRHSVSAPPKTRLLEDALGALADLLLS